ncbi:MAG TPA: hypothetical protein VKB88_13270 [Bryobacteraceae bacterium]|nr:hypothetical protein [Bryobacteraceae bacterium]
MINLTKVLAVMVGCLVAVAPAQAQNSNCRPIHLLLQANLDLSPGGQFWHGTVRGFLDNSIPLYGTLHGISGDGTIATGQAGHDLNLRFKFDFGAKGVFVTEPSNDTMPYSRAVTGPLAYPPPAFAFGSYMYTSKIAPYAPLTSGWFLNATGNISIIGTFLADYASLPALNDVGAWNAEINGRICNVTPQP